MSLLEERRSQLITETISILQAAKKKITDNSDLMWTSFGTAKEFRADIDRCIDGLKNSDAKLLDSAFAHFQPSFDLQEHAMQNDWSDEYMQLAARFDKLYEQLKPLLPSTP
jgi:hypothetical protein